MLLFSIVTVFLLWIEDSFNWIFIQFFIITKNNAVIKQSLNWVIMDNNNNKKL